MAKIYIVGTPIGNLKDLTFRALEILQKVDIIACEDTRVTIKLLNHYQIKNKKLIPYYDHNEKKFASKKVIDLVKSNNDVAIVSDAGMPAVSDPGFILLRKAREENVEVEIIPGVSAQVMAFIASNFSYSYTFLGFLSPKSGTRKNLLKTLSPGTYVLYVSSHKLISTLFDLSAVFGDSIQICLAKELTKIYESYIFGNPSEILSKIGSKIKGEYTLVFNFSK